jgi:hypothetical protein
MEVLSRNCLLVLAFILAILSLGAGAEAVDPGKDFCSEDPETHAMRLVLIFYFRKIIASSNMFLQCMCAHRYCAAAAKRGSREIPSREFFQKKLPILFVDLLSAGSFKG